MIDTLPLPVFLSNDKGEFIEANVIASRLSGFTNAQDMVGRHYNELPPALTPFSDIFILQDEQVIKDNVPLNFIELFLYADGKYHCHLGNKIPVIKDSQRLVQASLFDISEIINPLVCELLALHSIDTEIKSKKSFCYQLDSQAVIKTPLTKRELHCIRFLMQNHSNKMIAQQLNVSVRTIDSHFEHIKDKVGVNLKAHIINRCIEYKLLPIDAFFAAC